MVSVDVVPKTLYSLFVFPSSPQKPDQSKCKCKESTLMVVLFITDRIEKSRDAESARFHCPVFYFPFFFRVTNYIESFVLQRPLDEVKLN